MTQRVRIKGQEQSGIVIDSKVEDNTVWFNVHWGTDQRGMITDWIKEEELEPLPYKVVGDDD